MTDVFSPDERFDAADMLHRAAFDGDVEQVRRLLDSGVDVDVEAEPSGTALHAAIENGRVDVVRLLLGRGAEVQKSGNGRFTPLAHAIDAACDGAQQVELDELDSEWIEIIRLLLSRGADPFVVSRGAHRPLTAISIARDYGRRELAELLTVAGMLSHGRTAAQIVECVSGITTEDVKACEAFLLQ
jgi:ankyrin repeat protein